MDSWNHLIAGGVSGLATCIILQPLDLIKTRLQQPMSPKFKELMMNLFKENSIQGLWRGTWPTIYRNVPGNALYFGSLHEIKSALTQYTSLSPGIIHLTSGISCRVLVGTLLMPMTVLKIRFESNYYNYKSVYSAFKDIVSKEGWKGLFIGLGPTIMRDAPYAGIYFYFYEKYKSVLGQSFGLGMRDNPILVNVMAGSLSGISSTLITQPFDLIKSRMQLKPVEYPHFIKTLKKIISEEGLVGFSSGLIPRLTRKTLNSVIAWTVYEQMILLLKTN